MADKEKVKVELTRQRIVKDVLYPAGEQEVTADVAEILKRQNSLVEKSTSKTTKTTEGNS